MWPCCGRCYSKKGVVLDKQKKQLISLSQWMSFCDGHREAGHKLDIKLAVGGFVLCDLLKRILKFQANTWGNVALR